MPPENKFGSLHRLLLHIPPSRRWRRSLIIILEYCCYNGTVHGESLWLPYRDSHSDRLMGEMTKNEAVCANCEILGEKLIVSVCLPIVVITINSFLCSLLVLIAPVALGNRRSPWKPFFYYYFSETSGSCRGTILDTLPLLNKYVEWGWGHVIEIEVI